MPLKRRVRGAKSLGGMVAVALGVMLGSLTAHAAPRWIAPKSCASAQTFRAMLRERKLGQSSEVRFEVRAQDGGYQMQVRDGRVVTHRLRAEGCDELLDAALMILQLAQQEADLDESSKAKAQRRGRPKRKATPKPPPETSGRVSEGDVQSDESDDSIPETAPEAINPPPESPEPRNQETQAGAEKSSPPIETKQVTPDKARSKKAGPQANERSEIKTARAKRKRKKPKRRVLRNSQGLEGLVMLEGGGAWGALPAFHGQGLLRLGLRARAWEVSAAGIWRGGVRSPSAIQPIWRTRFQVWGGRLQGCYILNPGRLRLPLCVGAELGQLESWRGGGTSGSTRLRTMWWALHAQARAEYDLGAWLFVLAAVEASVLPRRPSIEVENGPRLCCSAVTGALRLGAGVRFGRGGK